MPEGHPSSPSPFGLGYFSRFPVGEAGRRRKTLARSAGVLKVNERARLARGGPFACW